MICSAAPVRRLGSSRTSLMRSECTLTPPTQQSAFTIGDHPLRTATNHPRLGSPTSTRRSSTSTSTSPTSRRSAATRAATTRRGRRLGTRRRLRLVSGASFIIVIYGLRVIYGGVRGRRPCLRELGLPVNPARSSLRSYSSQQPTLTLYSPRIHLPELEQEHPLDERPLRHLGRVQLRAHPRVLEARHGVRGRARWVVEEAVDGPL